MGPRRVLRRHAAWWVIGPVLYFTFIWLQWGTRIKPRYMVPVAPVLFLFLWSGMTCLIVSLRAIGKGRGWNAQRVGRIVMMALVGVVLLGNLFPWAVEFYVRHLSSRNFYDAARRAAYSQLVDIGAYAQQHVPEDQVMWMNAGAHRRIAYFLTGRKIDTSELNIRDWKDWDLLVEESKQASPATNPATVASTGPATEPSSKPTTLPTAGKKRLTYAQRRKRFFNGIARQARYLIVFVDHPTKGESWPGWHLPMRADDHKMQWWRLYERQPDETWKAISVPRSRDYVRLIPPVAK